MARAEDELKKRYSNQEINNNAIDSEDLWNDISNELDESKAISTKNNHKKKLFYFVFFIAALIATTCIVTNNTSKRMHADHSSANNPNLNLETVSTENGNTTKQEKKDYKRDTESIEKITSKELIPTVKNQETKNEINQYQVSKEFAQSPNETNNKTNKKQVNKKQGEIYKSEILNNEISILNFLSENENPRTTSIKNNYNELKEKLVNSNGQNELKEHLTSQKIPTLEFRLKSKYREINTSKIISNTVLKEDKVKGKTYEIGITGGLNMLKFKYGSNNFVNLKNAKETSESSIIGYNIGLESSITWKEKYIFSTGIEYNHLWSKFDYTKSNHYQEIRPNQIIKIWVNSTTNDTLRTETGEVIINGVTRRKVVHHNNYKRFSIPLEIGLRKQIGLIELGVKTGATINFTTAQKGRNIDENFDFINFEKGDVGAPYKAFDIGLRVNTFIGFKYTDRLTFRLHPTWSWNKGNTFDSTDINLSIHQFRLNFGASYSIN